MTVKKTVGRVAQRQDVFLFFFFFHNTPKTHEQYRTDALCAVTVIACTITDKPYGVGADLFTDLIAIGPRDVSGVVARVPYGFRDVTFRSLDCFDLLAGRDGIR